ncbi:putative retrotransposon gag domain-containing protein [Helianthus debilis subsp. tardiflorus]
MPLFLSDEEYARCSHDASMITHKADAYITQLYIQLETENSQSIDKDREIERLSQEVSELQKSKTQLLQLIEHKDLEISEKNSSIKGCPDKIVSFTDTASSKEQINEETSARIQFDPEVILMVHNMVKFHGLPDEDPYRHIANFLEICGLLEFCGTFKIVGASVDAIRLRLFPFTLRDKAQLWRRSLHVGSVTTWDAMAEKFVSKYFPPSKTNKLRKVIYNFRQEDGESLYETWERFNDLLRKCPTHRISPESQVRMFYDGLSIQTSEVIDIASGLSLFTITPEAAFDLIEKAAMRDYHWEPIRDKPSTLGVHEVDAITSLTAKLEALNRKIEQMQQVNALRVSCELCGGPHPSRDCQQGNMFASHEQVDYMENQVRPQNDSYNNTYNPSQRNYPNSPPYQQEQYQYY